MVAAYAHRRRRTVSPRISCRGRQGPTASVCRSVDRSSRKVRSAGYRLFFLRTDKAARTGEALPELRASLDAISGRLLDLLPIMRDAVYFPEFGYSYSIKSVAPAL